MVEHLQEAHPQSITLTTTTMTTTPVTADTITPQNIMHAWGATIDAAASLTKLQRSVDRGDITPEMAAERYNQIVADMADALAIN